MTTIKTIKNQILSFEPLDDTIAVEFEDHIIEVDKADLKNIEVTKDSLAKVIFDKHQVISKEIASVKIDL